jgi:hypothetical protein
MNDKTCYDCALFSKEHHACLRTRMAAQSTDHCSHWIAELPVCSLCGRQFMPPATIYYESIESEPLTLCNDCYNHRGHCKTCTAANYCDFKENTTCQLPPMVQQTMRQGNMIMTRTVPNMARVEETCKKNCKCYDATNNCCARGNFGTCANYDMRKGDSE